MVGSKTEMGSQLRGVFPEPALTVWWHGLVQPFQPGCPRCPRISWHRPAPDPPREPEGLCCGVSLLKEVTSSSGTRCMRRAVTHEGECPLQLHSSAICKGFPNPAGWGALKFIPQSGSSRLYSVCGIIRLLGTSPWQLTLGCQWL